MESWAAESSRFPEGNSKDLEPLRRPRATRAEARRQLLYELASGASGLVLAVFMWGHMLLVSSILLGMDAMYTVTRLFEGYYFFGRSYPALVSGIVGIVIVVFVVAVVRILVDHLYV